MTKSKLVKPIQCEPTDHMFTHVNTTPVIHGGTFGQTHVQTPSFTLYCLKCGEVRAL